MRARSKRYLCIFTLLLCISCSGVERRDPTTAEREAEGALSLGSHTFPISTDVREAQAAFDRAFTLTLAFSHYAAEKEFRAAAALAPNEPLPWWGVALVNGPHINYPLVPEEKAKIAWEALNRARELRANGNQLEQELVDALSARYQGESTNDRSKLDLAYAQAMEQVWDRHPTNADVAVLYAEALMDLHPWDYWERDGQPKAWTPEILTTLERAMELNPKHAGAHHLYIHAVEASSDPSRAVPSADTLRTLVPGAGHLVHMPAHIYVRVGRWEDAALANERAVKADQQFRKLYPRSGFTGLYMIHNQHFLSFVRMMQGQQEAALTASREMIANIPPDFLVEYGAIADGFMAMTLEVLTRFGKWNEILREPAPAPELPIANAMWHFARATAYNALDQRKEAKLERGELLRAMKRVPKEATFGNNNAQTLLKLALHVLDGEMAANDKRFDAAIRSLQAAVKIEDSLVYDEPPDWIIPVRHTLGVTLLRAGRPQDAEQVYREDLVRFPNNGWALVGLSEALKKQGRVAEAALAATEFEREWQGSDIKTETSCLCQPSV